MSTQHSSGLRTDLYDGAYGKTLRIATRNPKSLVFLRSMFEALAAQKAPTLVLGRDQGAYMENCDAIMLSVGETCARPLELKVDETGTTIVCCQSPVGWRRSCGLIDGLLDYGRGHQYLTEMEPSPILIELSYRE